MSDLEDLEVRIDELESRLDSLESIIHDGRASNDVTGMREFVEQQSPGSHVERALAIAYYLDQFEGKENFTSGDINEGYRTCRVQKPANISDVLSGLEDREWVMDDGKDGNTKLRRLTAEALDEIERPSED